MAVELISGQSWDWPAKCHSPISRAESDVELGLKLIRSLLRKQPVLTTVLIAGAVNGLMGSAENNTSLALFGFVLAMTGLLGLTFGVSCRSQFNHPKPANINLLDIHSANTIPVSRSLPAHNQEDPSP